MSTVGMNIQSAARFPEILSAIWMTSFDQKKYEIIVTQKKHGRINV